MDVLRGPRPRDSASFKRRLFWWIGAFLVILSLVDWWYERHKEHRYDAQILEVSRRYAVEPALVKAVVWRESRFNAKTRGRVGEIGLMQIRPLTAQEFAQTDQRKRVFDGNLFDPDVNLQVGAWYLGKLLKRYGRTDNAVPYALADYNAGRSNVLRWNNGSAETNSARFISQITFPGTREYVRSIIRRSTKYRGSL
jgi:soluble lytic murein transglycosylase